MSLEREEGEQEEGGELKGRSRLSSLLMEKTLAGLSLMSMVQEGALGHVKRELWGGFCRLVSRRQWDDFGGDGSVSCFSPFVSCLWFCVLCFCVLLLVLGIFFVFFFVAFSFFFRWS